MFFLKLLEIKIGGYYLDQAFVDTYLLVKASDRYKVFFRMEKNL